MRELWEILVPTTMETPNGDVNPVRTRHHRVWDKYVRGIAGGLTIFKPVHGQWIHEEELYSERMIPVRIACDEMQMMEIVRFTLKHYRQIAVMTYRVSDTVLILREEDFGKKTLRPNSAAKV